MALKKLWRGPGVYGELDSLKKYLGMLDTYLEKARKDLESQPIFLGFVDTRWRYSEVFPRILRNSFLVTILSYLEDELAWMCKSLRTRKNIPISWSKLKGNALERAKVYISKLGRLDFPTGHSWAEINSYNTIRNCIVHNMGIVSGFSKEKEIRDYCLKHKGIDIDKHGNLILSKEFCLQAVSTVQTFFEELYDSYERKKAPMTYHIYENWTVHKAKVHFSDCSFCNNGKGIHPNAGPNNGRWLGPFATLDEALQAAQATGEPVSKCKFCRP